MNGSSPLGSSSRGTALLERRETLDPTPTSAGEARRLLREALLSIERADWVDAGELAISEIVTNASLHAHTAIDVRIGVYDDEVCVEVRDYNPILPVEKELETEATTGRGMGLVAAVARHCGVHSLGEDGKVVWFCVGDPADARRDEALAAWDVDEWPHADGATDDRRHVVLRSMPATLWLSARQHHDTILREMVFYLAEHGGLDVDFAAADQARAAIGGALLDALEDARAAGTARPAVPDGHPGPLPWVPDGLDLGIDVPADAGRHFAALQDLLDAAESLAVQGELFAHPGLPEIVAVRDWACEQVIAQLAGTRPAPWPGTALERFEVAVHDRAQPQLPEWDATVVLDATSPVIAADDANRIIAVSRPLGDLLGWQLDDLMGRRVVTVIPPSLREAHVAGFSRHLSTGEAHVIGVPLELPVLCKDGSELRCRFLIEQLPDTSDRSVYVAWIDPLDADRR